MSGLVERFAALFAGRTDIRGTEYGSAERHAPDFKAHLSGTAQGVYPLVWHGLMHGQVGDSLPMGWGVKWGCVDLDVKAPGKRRWDYEDSNAAFSASRDLVKALDLGWGIKGWIEQTKSGGMHVWVFADDWVLASSMRRTLLVACSVSGVPVTEVNPKAESGPTPEFVGNYVRLPYVGAFGREYGTIERPIIESEAFGVDSHRRFKSVPIPLVEFLDLAEQHLVSAETLGTAASLWEEPEPVGIIHYGEVSEDVDAAIMAKMGPLARKIFHEGPYDGMDRSKALFKLAAKAGEDGLTPEEVLAVVTEADAAWGKFYARPNGDRELAKIVERAING